MRKQKEMQQKSLFWNKLEIKQKNFENILRKIEEKVWRVVLKVGVDDVA